MGRLSGLFSQTAYSFETDHSWGRFKTDLFLQQAPGHSYCPLNGIKEPYDGMAKLVSRKRLRGTADE